MREGLSDIIKPYFFPHFSCFQYGAGGDERWFAAHCLDYTVVTDNEQDYIYLCNMKTRFSLYNLSPCFVLPAQYSNYILHFAPDYFNLIAVQVAPPDFALSFSDIISRLKPWGIIAVPVWLEGTIPFHWLKIYDGVYRKP